MTTLYLIRHAEAEGNRFFRSHGTYDSCLTVFGRTQLNFLVNRFSTVKLDAVYSSNLSRANESAKAIANIHAIPVQIDSSFQEIHVGVWEDRVWGNIYRDYPKEIEIYNKDPLRWHVEAAEPVLEVQRRMLMALRDMETRYPNGTIAIVSHGDAMRILFTSLLNSDPLCCQNCQKVLRFNNTSVSHLTVENGRISVLSINDTTHLPQEYSSYAHQKRWIEDADGNPIRPWIRQWDSGRDTTLFARLYHDAWRCAHGDAAFDPSPYLHRAIRESRDDPNSILVEMIGDVPAGVIELQKSSESDPHAFHIAFFAMEERYRGKGISPVLMGEAVSQCRRIGKHRIRLCVAPNNYRARGYYRHFGFVPVGEFPGALGPLVLLERSV